MRDDVVAEVVLLRRLDVARVNKLRRFLRVIRRQRNGMLVEGGDVVELCALQK